MMHSVKDIDIKLDLILLQEQVAVKDLMKLGVGSIWVSNVPITTCALLSLDGQVLAKGNVVQVDENYGLEITEIQQ